LNAWCALNPDVVRVVTTTSRAPRQGETDGVDYHFVTVQRFQEMARSGEFWEFKEVHGNWYASPRRETERFVTAGKIAVLKIDVQGALDVMRVIPSAISVFLRPPSAEELESRLRGRCTDDEITIQKRLANAERELEFADLYQYQIVNLTIADTVRTLNDIVRGHP
jgi:guanylate kinase